MADVPGSRPSVRGQPVFSFALLLDRSPDWLPCEFDNRIFGTGCRFRVRPVKVSRWRGREDDLRSSVNPFAQVILTWLALQETSSGLHRLGLKSRLARGMLERGLDPGIARGLLRFLWCIVRLPEQLERQFEAEIRAMAETTDDVFMLPWERDGYIRGTLERSREDILRVLAARFGEMPDRIQTALSHIEKDEILNRLCEAAATADDLPSFEGVLAEQSDTDSTSSV